MLAKKKCNLDYHKNLITWWVLTKSGTKRGGMKRWGNVWFQFIQVAALIQVQNYQTMHSESIVAGSVMSKVADRCRSCSHLSNSQNKLHQNIPVRQLWHLCAVLVLLGSNPKFKKNFLLALKAKNNCSVFLNFQFEFSVLIQFFSIGLCQKLSKFKRTFSGWYHYRFVSGTWPSAF